MQDVGEKDTAPVVYGYLDFRRWIEDWLRWKRVKNQRYSYRVFARASGLAVGTLHNILSGRRSPSAESIACIARAIRLSAEEEAFFADLVLLTDGTEIAIRNAVLERVLAHPEVQEVRRLEGQYVTYVSHWYHVAIRELAQLPGFRADPHWIAGSLGHGVTHEQVASGLETLLALGLLVPDETGTLRPAELRTETPPQVAGLAFLRHHEEILALTTAALRTVPPQERFYGAVTLTLPAARFEELRNELLAFLRGMMNRLDQPDQAPDCVYQLNAQLFPLTAPRTTVVALPLDGD